MNVHSCMKHNVVSISATATIREAAEMFVKRHVGLLPVVDEKGKPIGVVNLHDLMTLELPDFVNLIADVDFVHNFGAVETTRPSSETLARSVTTRMKPVLAIPENSGLLRAYALLLQHNLLDLLVVNDNGKLVGIVSRVDIGAAILSSWPAKE